MASIGIFTLLLSQLYEMQNIYWIKSYKAKDDPLVWITVKELAQMNFISTIVYKNTEVS